MKRFGTIVSLSLLMTSSIFGQDKLGTSPDGTVGARCLLGYLMEMQAARELCVIGSKEQNDAIDQAVVATSKRLVELGFEDFSEEEIDKYRDQAKRSMKQSVPGFGSVAAFCSNIEMVQSAFSADGLRDYMDAIETSKPDLISVKSCGQM
jgi:hypothetical protein